MGQWRSCGKASSLTDAGVVQISVNKDQPTWSQSFPAGFLVAGSETEFWVRVDPESLVEPDDGTYEYDFSVTQASGGLSLYNVGHNLAHVTGKVQLDQAGLLLYVACIVIDSTGASDNSSSMSGKWGTPAVQQTEAEVQQTKKSKSTK